MVGLFSLVFDQLESNLNSFHIRLLHNKTEIVKSGMKIHWKTPVLGRAVSSFDQALCKCLTQGPVW